MPAASALPTEVLLSIFESAADYDPLYIDVEALRYAYERNATLAACALVCRAWRGPAQRVLFYDISLGATADPANADIENVDGPRAQPGRTDAALASLISTLKTFRDNDTDHPLRRNIRSLHLCVGHTDVLSYNSDLPIDHVVHGSPEDVVRVITLCPGLIHLSLTIGVLHDDGSPNIFVVFPPSALHVLAAEKPPNLRQLSVNFIQDETFVHAHDYYWPITGAAYSVIAALASGLTVLNVDIRLDYDGGASDEEPDGSIPALPLLHTLHCGSSTPELRSAIYARAPSLRTAVVSFSHQDTDLHEFIPSSVENLTIGYLSRTDDISQFRQLKRLAVRYFHTTVEEIPISLRTIPPSLEHLQLPASIATVESVADMLVEVTRSGALPNLKSLTFARQRHSPPVVIKQVFDVPVEVVYEPQHLQIFPCAD